MRYALFTLFLGAGIAAAQAPGRLMPGQAPPPQAPPPGAVVVPAPLPVPAPAEAKPADDKPEHAKPEKVTPTECCGKHYRQFRLPCVGKWAHFAGTPNYFGYFVGGNVAHFGRGPCHDEGTWGWDYGGCIFTKRVALLWNPCRYQAGMGAYKTDGPKLRKEE